jgi:hypothetical protein
MAGATQRERNQMPAPQMGKLCAYLLELLDGTRVNTTALVDQVCIPL